MNLLRSYIKNILLEKRKGKDAEWQYLLSEPFQARNYLACAWCKDHKSILEVGSYKNPIYEFYDSGAAELITVVDPKASTFEDKISVKGRDIKIISLGKKLHELNIPNHDVVVALGLGIPNPKKGPNKSYQALKELCKNAKTVILEGAVDWPETVEQIGGIIESLDRHNKAVDIRVDYSDSDIKDPDAPGKVYDDRRFVVLELESK